MNGSKRVCPLVFGCDGSYAMPLATTLRSIAETNRSGSPVDAYVLSHNFPETTKRKVVDSLPVGSCSIRWLPVDLTPFAGFSTLRHISSATYARLLIPRILPRGTERVLYLDADILVLDDLRPLCELDLGHATIGAVLDERLDIHIKNGNSTLNGLPLPRVGEYFNAGVLLIDVARWKAERVSEKALEYLQRCPHSVYSDQDALNVACDGRWMKMDCRWNFYQIDLKEPLTDLSPTRRPCIIHFHGCLKPWDPGALNMNAGFYDGYRARTKFARTPIEKVRRVPMIAWSRLKRSLRRYLAVTGILKRLQLRAAAARRLSS